MGQAVWEEGPWGLLIGWVKWGLRLARWGHSDVVISDLSSQPDSWSGGWWAWKPNQSEFKGHGGQEFGDKKEKNGTVAEEKWSERVFSFKV